MRRADVIILGGGIIGCALAEELARRGQRVIVVERGSVGSEASGAAAGILAAQVDLSSPGPLFELCQASRRLYPRWIAHLERCARRTVGYHANGILYLVSTRREAKAMERQARWQRKAGLRVERWVPTEIRRHEPAIDGRFICAYHFPTEAQVDNVSVMGALAVALRRARVTLREHTQVRRLRLRGQTVQGVETDHGSLAAPVVVNCLGSWADMDGRFPVRLSVEPIRGQMLAFQGPKRLIHRTIMSARAYAVQRHDGQLLVGSTIERAGFNKSLTLEGMHAILCGLRYMSRALHQCTFCEAWAGLRPATQHGRPLMGKTPVEGLYVSTGHYRHGILLAPIAARLMADLILQGRASFDLSPFSPGPFRADY